MERELEAILVPRVDHGTVLAVIRREMEAVFGQRLRRLILFGSRARGDGRPDSDFDVAVILDEPFSWRNQHAATDRQYDIWRETGASVEPKVMTDADLQQERWFYFDIRTEGRPF